MLSVKQRGIKYHFKSLWYNGTWDWTQISRTIGKLSTHYTNEPNTQVTLVYNIKGLMQL